MFAAAWNAQLPRFYSRNSQPGAEAVDAFSTNWRTKRCYLFPPFNLIQRCLAKIQREQATTILVCPYWNSRPWFPVLLEMAVDIPLVILPRKDLLQASDETTHPLCQDRSFLLSVWKLSGMAIEAREFRRKCENFSWPETVPAHPQRTSRPGTVGVADVLKDIWIPWKAI